MPVLQHLKRQHGILRFFLNFPLYSTLGGSPHDQQSSPRQASGYQGKRQHEFGAKSQVGPRSFLLE
jgi:hypothetical protein